jgi:hypothetical protein
LENSYGYSHIILYERNFDGQEVSIPALGNRPLLKLNHLLEKLFVFAFYTKP